MLLCSGVVGSVLLGVLAYMLSTGLVFFATLTIFAVNTRLAQHMNPTNMTRLNMDLTPFVKNKGWGINPTQSSLVAMFAAISIGIG